MSNKLAISNCDFTGEFTNKAMPSLKYSINYPQASTEGYHSFVVKWNKETLTKAYTLASYCARRLYDAAIRRYERPNFGGYTLGAFELYQDYTITSNDGKNLSLYYDRYTYEGGANGTTVRNSENWRIDKARKLHLAELFPPKFPYRAYLEKEIIQQIEQQNQSEEGGNYFENYPQLVHQYFDPSHFYLTNHAVTIFYPEITIAPHSSGIVAFDIVLPYPQSVFESV